MSMKCMMVPKSSLSASSDESKLNQKVKREHRLAFGGSDESMVPENFIWPDKFKATESVPELMVPHLDLKKFFSGNKSDVEEATRQVDEACRKHGFFVVVNHGVDMELLKDVHQCMDEFFTLPLDVKQRAQRIYGENFGFSNGFIGRFSSKLPWKESFSLPCLAGHNTAHDYVCDHLGQEFSHHGKAYQECAKALNYLAMKLVKILELSLGVPREQFQKLYEDNDSIMRLNYYPRCEKPELTLGTGPHCDPTSITILHQDHVSGLQVYVNDQWQTIPPTKNAFVINIGDTFMSLTNGVYKSCLHRAIVNCKEARTSMAYFLCPAADKVLRAPKELVEKNPPRKFPDYTWSKLLEMTQKYYRPDPDTFKAFTTWIQQEKLGTDSPIASPSA